MDSAGPRSGISWRAASLLLALALPACMITESNEGEPVEAVEYAKPERIRENVRKLGDRSIPFAVLDRVQEELVLAGRPAEAELVAALGNADAHAKAQILIVLGLFRNPELVKDIAPHLADPVAEVAMAAAAALAKHGVRDGIPLMIRGLRHEDLRIRDWCNICLIEATGQHFGFRANDPLDRREFSIRKWEEWWRSEGATTPLNPQD
jgi:hypothetical protein